MRPHRKWVAKSGVIEYWTFSYVSIWIDGQRVESFWLAGFRYNVIIVTVLRWLVIYVPLSNTGTKAFGRPQNLQDYQSYTLSSISNLQKSHPS